MKKRDLRIALRMAGRLMTKIKESICKGCDGSGCQFNETVCMDLDAVMDNLLKKLEEMK